MLMSPNMRGIATLTHNSRVGPHGTISVELMHAIRLVIRLTLSALQTRVALCPDTDPLTRLNESDFRSNTKCSADDFCFPLA